ncbi:MAG: hypothetical protein AB8B65_00805 [Kordia sp.]|uniref:hypothetical protein n=1 Tax=Kordia sp. TaxID=1965332 RepID=UPI00385EC759
MKHVKPTHIIFCITALLMLVCAAFFEKQNIVYVYPFPVIAIFWMYMTEKKEPLSILYVLTLAITIVGGVLLLLGLRKFTPEVSILFSLYYIFYMRLMYLKNERKKTNRILYFRLALIVLPIIYIYDRVMCLIYKEISDTFAYFAVLVILVLIYIIVALYYYLRNKNQTNLWMLIASCNIGIMNLIIMINELYVTETFFTVIALFCCNLKLYFAMKFMLEDEKNTLPDIV